MSDYDVKIKRKMKEYENGTVKTEIWAEIFEKVTGEKMDKLIWWEDEDGVYHDETINLPGKLRDAVDNAWIEHKRKW